MKPWNIKQLYNSYQEDLKTVTSAFERSMIVGVMMLDIRQTATSLSTQRKLTPCETAIIESLCISI
jgi:hypothetical protein